MWHMLIQIYRNNDYPSRIIIDHILLTGWATKHVNLRILPWYEVHLE